MEFEQKAEEKKMSMSKNIARLAVTAGLTAALSFGGVMAPVTMAFAAGSGSTVTFNDPGYEAFTTYKGIQIFTATVTTTAGGTTVSNIAWASSDVQTAVVNAIKEKDESYISNNAQDAADWLNKHNAGIEKTDESTRISSGHVLNKIAADLKNSGGWHTTAAGSASLSGLTAGYWLFLTNSVAEGSNTKSKDVFTSPVYAVVDGTNNKVVTPKKSVPAVDKKNVSAKGDNELDASDSHVGQDVTFNLYGTIADNYDTYDTYYYQFSDQISKGLTLQDGAQVYLYASKDAAQKDFKHENPMSNITDSFTPDSGDADANGNKTTTWTCSNLKSVVGVTSESCIVVSYKAKINSEAAIGGNAGNTNTATLTYSNNPMTTDTGTTVPDEVKTYTYGLKLNKVDLGTEEALKDSNIKFTIKVKSAADSNLVGRYVKSDGTLVDAECKLSVTNGAITIKGLGAGTYTVVETDAPANYDKVQPFDFTITPNRDSEASGKSPVGAKYEISTSQKDQVIIGTPNDAKDDNKLEAEAGTATNGDGTFNITVGDTKHVGLPLTGLNGVTFTWIAGGAVLCIGVAHLIRSRKQAEESEQE